MSSRRLLVAAAALAACATTPPAAPSRPAAQADAAPATGGPWAPTPPPPPLAAVHEPPPKVTRATLPNGLRIVVVEHHRRPVVLTTVVFPRGALIDPDEGAGLTYLAVSMATDFYETSPDGEEIFEEKSFRRLAAEMGGAVSFGVGADTASIGISGYARDAKDYVEMLAGALMRPRHGSRMFRARRNATYIAIEDLESADPEALRQVVGEASFGEGHPYSHSPYGTMSSLAVVGLEDVATQQQVLFVPDGATLLVVGDVRADAMVAAARAAFGRWRGTAAPRPRVPPAVAGRGQAAVSFLERRLAGSLVVCAARPLSDVRASSAALDVLAALLGQGTESRLGSALREKSGVAYWASADVVLRQQARAFIACSAVAADDAPHGVQLFRGVLEAARETAPTAEEIERAKGIRLAELDSAWDDAASVYGTWMTALTVGSGTPRLDAERAAIESVTPQEVQRLAHTLFHPSTVKWVFSGDRRAAAHAAEVNHLGRLSAK